VNPDISYILIFAIVLLSFSLRSFAGFGGALLCIPLLSFFFNIEEVVPLEALLEVYISLILLFQTYRQVIWKEVFILLTGAILGSVLGMVVLVKYISNSMVLYFVLGLAGLGTGLFFLINKNVNSVFKSKLSPVFGFIGGFFGSLIGTSGLPYIIYFRGRSFDKKEIRSSLIFVFLIDYLSRVVFFTYSDRLSKGIFIQSLWLVPALLISFFFGKYFFIKASNKIFKLITSIIIILTSILLLIKNILL